MDDIFVKFVPRSAGKTRIYLYLLFGSRRLLWQYSLALIYTNILYYCYYHIKHRNTWHKRCIRTYSFKTEIFITQQNKLEANKMIDRSTPSMCLWLIDWLLVAAGPSVNISCIFRNWPFLVMTRDLGWMFRCAPCSSGTLFFISGFVVPEYVLLPKNAQWSPGSPLILKLLLQLWKPR